MEVQTEYKQTDIGVIPGDWIVRSLKDVTVADGLVRGPFGGALKKEIFVRSGYRVYEQRNAIDRNTDSFRYFIDEKKFTELRRFQVEPGDFIVSCAGTIGQICRIGQHSPEGVINQALLKITVDPEVIHPDFFLRVFRSPSFQDRITENSHGGAMKNLVGMDVFRQVDIPLPPYEKQRAIAEALSDVDALIERLDALIAKKRAVKTATMQRLLTGQQRLPGFEGAWETRRLGEVADMSSGGTPLSSVSAYYGGSIPWASVSDLSDGGKYLFETERHLTEAGLQNSAAKLFPPRSILYAMYASIGEVSIASMETSSSQAILGIRTRAQLDTEFLYYLLAHRQEEIQKMGQQGTQANLNAGMVKNFRIPLPSDKEQDAIVNILSDMDAEIEALGARRDKTQALKQGMMQVLLTGRTRLL